MEARPASPTTATVQAAEAAHAALVSLVRQGNAAYDVMCLEIRERMRVLDVEFTLQKLRAAWLAHQVARALGMTTSAALEIGFAVSVRDEGMRFVSPRILNQTRPLTSFEASVVKSHTELGALFLRRRASFFGAPMRMAVDVSLLHHERYDGSGYPKGLSGDGIPIEAQIGAVVDVYLAVQKARADRPALDARAAFDHVARRRGTAFSPRVVDALAEAVASIELEHTLTDVKGAYAAARDEEPRA